MRLTAFFLIGGLLVAAPAAGAQTADKNPSLGDVVRKSNAAPKKKAAKVVTEDDIPARPPEPEPAQAATPAAAPAPEANKPLVEDKALTELKAKEASIQGSINLTQARLDAQGDPEQRATLLATLDTMRGRLKEVQDEIVRVGGKPTPPAPEKLVANEPSQTPPAK